MKDKHPITSYITVFQFWKLRVIKIKNYRFKVIEGVRPKDYPEEVGSIRYEIKWN